MAASLSFSTPIHHQSNLTVYGRGRYRFSDVTRTGVPLPPVLLEDGREDRLLEPAEEAGRGDGDW